MKKIIAITAFVMLAISQNLIAQIEKATIVIFREPNFYGAAITYPVKVNGFGVVKIKNSSYFTYSIIPGTYEISAKTEKESKVNVTLFSGDTAYVRCSILPGFWVGRPELITVEKNYGITRVNDPLMINLSSIVYKEFDSKWGLGALLGGGAGFERIDAFTTTTGDNVTLSSGGGALIGGAITYRVEKNFEATFDMDYSISSLSQSLKNAEADFTRCVARFTVWGVTPLKGGFLKLKYGIGGGNYFAGKLTLDGSKIDGNTYEFKYDPAFGFHGGIELESVYDTYYLSFGLLYNSVKYKVNSFSLNSVDMPLSSILDKKISNPNGSGLMFTMGFGFNIKSKH